MTERKRKYIRYANLYTACNRTVTKLIFFNAPICQFENLIQLSMNDWIRQHVGTCLAGTEQPSGVACVSQSAIHSNA